MGIVKCSHLQRNRNCNIYFCVCKSVKLDFNMYIVYKFADRNQDNRKSVLDPSMNVSMDLGSWTIFSLLDREFTAQIRLACVFGNLGNEALIVTRDDQVYALGSNGAGCLGLGDMHSTLTPKQVIKYDGINIY